MEGKGALITYLGLKETLQGHFAPLQTQKMENLWRGQVGHLREPMAVSCTAAHLKNKKLFQVFPGVLYFAFFKGTCIALNKLLFSQNINF